MCVHKLQINYFYMSRSIYNNFLFDKRKRKSDTPHMNAQMRVKFRALREANTIEVRNCLVWTGACGSRGYGQVYLGKTRVAHRANWIYYNGSIPKGLMVIHSCDNRLCVRLEHLRLGTAADNCRDRTERNPRSHSEGHPRARLTSVDIVAILLLYGSGMFRLKVLGPVFGVHPSVISGIAHGDSWGHLPFQQRRPVTRLQYISLGPKSKHAERRLRMRKIQVHDKAVVVVLSRLEAKAVLSRLNQHTGVKESKVLLAAKRKLLFEIEYE